MAVNQVPEEKKVEEVVVEQPKAAAEAEMAADELEQLFGQPQVGQPQAEAPAGAEAPAPEVTLRKQRTWGEEPAPANAEEKRKADAAKAAAEIPAEELDQLFAQQAGGQPQEEAPVGAEAPAPEVTLRKQRTWGRRRSRS